MNDALNFPKVKWDRDDVFYWVKHKLSQIEGVSLWSPGNPVDEISGFWRVEIRLHRPDLTVGDLFNV